MGYQPGGEIMASLQPDVTHKYAKTIILMPSTCTVYDKCTKYVYITSI